MVIVKADSYKRLRTKGWERHGRGGRNNGGDKGRDQVVLVVMVEAVGIRGCLVVVSDRSGGLKAKDI